MEHYLCQTCGTQYAPSDAPPERCLICDDERQYIGWGGQHWTTLAALRSKHQAKIEVEEPGLVGLGMEPSFGIGQRAQLVQSAEGNVLWECIPLIDDALVEEVRKLGGVAAIALSHPHYYSAMVEWSRAFGDAPIYLHAADRRWVMRPDPAIVFWEGTSHRLNSQATLIHCGGHFAGSALLHWAAGAGGQGALLAGDTIYVATDRRTVSFMYSFPNLIPLGPASVQAIVQAVAPLTYDRIYSAWFDRTLPRGAREAVAYSADRYLRAIADQH